MLNALVDKILTQAKRDKTRFRDTDFEKDGEIFCSKCKKRKLAKIKLPDSAFGKALDRDETGFLSVVCTCYCDFSDSEISSLKRAKIDYFLLHKEDEEFTADDDLPFE